jgi:uracil-DNA glycosylase
VPSKDEQELCRAWLDREIELVNPKLIIPIGRLAISLFFDIKLPLEKIIGKQIKVDGRIIIPLPHPSGASTWHQKEANRKLVKKAIRLIEKQREEMRL